MEWPSLGHVFSSNSWAVLEQPGACGMSEVCLLQFPGCHAVSQGRSRDSPVTARFHIVPDPHAGIALFHTWARLTLGFDECWSSAASGISWHLNAAAGVNS